MRSLPKLLSIFLALLMLLSVFTIAPISAYAVDETEQSTTVDETKTAKGVDSVVKTADNDNDESDRLRAMRQIPATRPIPATRQIRQITLTLTKLYPRAIWLRPKV